MSFDQWFAALDKLGIAEGFFHPHGTRFLCTGSRARRPNKGEDGFFRQCFDDGMTPLQALGEARVEQDYA
jgi:hypothetical protein